jgi:hypothetical protein
VILILTSACLTAGASAKATNAVSALDVPKSATFSPFRRPDYSVHVMIFRRSGDGSRDFTSRSGRSPKKRGTTSTKLNSQLGRILQEA